MTNLVEIELMTVLDNAGIVFSWRDGAGQHLGMIPNQSDEYRTIRNALNAREVQERNRSGSPARLDRDPTALLPDDTVRKLTTHWRLVP